MFSRKSVLKLVLLTDSVTSRESLLAAQYRGAVVKFFHLSFVGNNFPTLSR